MRVRILARMPAIGYSGGRLLALTLAESLAMTGAEVDFIADTLPEMHQEFRSFTRIRFITADLHNLSPHADPNIDLVLIVPAQNDVYVHGEFLRHAFECRAKIAMINFESPNWFNALSPFKRLASVWLGWDIVSEHADLIYSISGEGDKWARDYYKNAPKSCQFDFSYPAINSILADLAPNSDEREKQIMFLTRVDPHKGFNALTPLLHEAFAGYRVLVFIGSGNVNADEYAKWRAKFQALGMDFEFRPPIIGVEKFTLMKRSALNYFPSRFEGFGIPPLEAAYCMCPTACSNLPVLREFGQDAFVYGDPADDEDMRRAAIEALNHGSTLRKDYDRLAEIARMEDYGRRVRDSFERVIG